MTEVGDSRICLITTISHENRVQTQVIYQDPLFMHILNPLRKFLSYLSRSILLQKIVPCIQVPSQRATTLPLQHHIELVRTAERIQHPHYIGVHTHAH